jgi:LCP family protein required for cell wall assembly
MWGQLPALGEPRRAAKLRGPAVARMIGYSRRMPPRSDDDLDWLYGRDATRRADPPPEPTRVMPSQGAPPSIAPATVYEPPPPAYPSTPGYGSGPPGRPNAPPPPGGLPPSRPPKRRHPVRNVLLVLLVLVLLIIGGLVGVPLYAWSQVKRVNDAPAGKRPADQPGTTFLLVGSDSREGLSKAEQKKLGTGGVAGQRTDTIMIVYTPPTGKPALISIPRDSYLSIPNHNKNKVNAAYALGGPKLLEQTVEQNTGLRIDGYLEIGFAGFVNVVDAVGGVEMCLPTAIKDKDSHIDLPKGCQTLNGIEALGYVRMRKADPRGDLGRVERQRAVLAAVAKKAASPATVINPVRYWNLSNSAGQAVTLGQQTGLLQTLTVANAMRKIAGGQGLTLTVPVANPGASTPVGSAVLWDDAKANAMFAEIASGDTSKLAKYAK